MDGKTTSPMKLVQGPIILILVGSLLLLSQTTPYDLSQTWPLLIITVGVLKLIERMTASSTGGNP